MTVGQRILPCVCSLTKCSKEQVFLFTECNFLKMQFGDLNNLKVQY